MESQDESRSSTEDGVPTPPEEEPGSPLDKPLHSALTHYQKGIHTVYKLLQEGNDVNAPSSNGVNALHLACHFCMHDVVSQLLKKGANVHAINKSGRTALHFCAYNGSADVARLLLQNGADPEVKNSIDGRTPLHDACEKGHEDVVRVLLEYGADLSTATMYGETPVDIAFAHNPHEKIRWLVALSGQSDSTSNNSPRHPPVPPPHSHARNNPTTTHLTQVIVGGANHGGEDGLQHVATVSVESTANPPVIRHNPNAVGVTSPQQHPSAQHNHSGTTLSTQQPQQAVGSVDRHHQQQGTTHTTSQTVPSTTTATLPHHDITTSPTPHQQHEGHEGSSSTPQALPQNVEHQQGSNSTSSSTLYSKPTNYSPTTGVTYVPAAAAATSPHQDSSGSSSRGQQQVLYYKDGRKDGGQYQLAAQPPVIGKWGRMPGEGELTTEDCVSDMMQGDWFYVYNPQRTTQTPCFVWLDDSAEALHWSLDPLVPEIHRAKQAIGHALLHRTVNMISDKGYDDNGKSYRLLLLFNTGGQLMMATSIPSKFKRWWYGLYRLTSEARYANSGFEAFANTPLSATILPADPYVADQVSWDFLLYSYDVAN